MTTAKGKELSAFGQAAVALDGEFTELAQLAAEIDSMSVHSDSKLDRARQLLARFEEISQRVGGGMQALAQALQDAKLQTEHAAEIVTRRAQEVLQRQRDTEAMVARFRTLGEAVRKTTDAIGQLRKPNETQLSAEAKELLTSRMPEFDTYLGVLVEEAHNLMKDAHAANMKALERNADSLRQTLQSAKHRLNIFVQRGGAETHH